MKKDLHTLLKVARLYYLENLTQREVADRMNLSRIKIHRMLSKAREEGIVEININEPPEDCSELEIRFEDSFQLKECIIVPTFADIGDIYREMASALGGILERELKSGEYLGIGWGTTIRGVAEHVYFSKKIPVNVVPIAGGLGHTAEKIHSNSIAALFASRIGGKGFVLNCPFLADSAEAKTIFMNEPSVKEVFSLSREISTAIVSISNLGTDMTVKRLNIFSEDDIRVLRDAGAIGDINAIYINEFGIPVENRLQDRVINMETEDLKAAKHVIGVAFGNKKARAIKAALLSKMIHTLITDKNTAEAVLAESAAVEMIK
jgi:DNA-binding transcriptional regulator LsrR (DeoR family)